MAIFIPKWEKFTNRKPSGPVELNEGHEWVNDNLVYAAVDGERDLVQDIYLGPRGYTGGQGNEAFGSDDSVTLASNALAGEHCRGVFGGTIGDSGNNNYDTLFYLGHFTSVSDQSGIWLAHATNNTLAFESRNNGSTNSAASVNQYLAGDEFSLRIAGTASNNNAYLTVEGEAGQSDTTNNGARRDITTPLLKYGRAGVARNQFLKYGYIYKTLDDTDATHSLQENPYQILKPRRKLFAVPSGATDTTAPILSSPTGTKTGSTTASGTVSTDEANGTLYYLASENATETAATIKIGSSQAVTAIGVQNVSFTGLTPSTLYYNHYVHDDAATNESNVVHSASYTTDAASAVIAIFRRRIEGQGNAFR